MSHSITNKMYVMYYVHQEKTNVSKVVAKAYKNHVPHFIQTINSVVVHTFAVLATLTLVGALIWIPINKFKDLSHQIDLETAEADFKARMKDVPPPADLPKSPLIFKTDKHAFNHINEYIIGSDNNLWVRRIGTSDWKAMFFDGDLTGTKPVKISADGCNLTVTDDKDELHYRKVLIEGRGKQETSKLRFLPHTTVYEKTHDKLSFDKDDASAYVAIDKTEKNNWKSMWYSFPIIHRIANLITGKLLKVNADFSISQRGRYTDFFTDAHGIQHYNKIGVTTGYQFDEENTSIRKFDPWAPKNANVHIYFPETTTTKFVGLKKDVSSSTLMVMGYEYDIEESKKTLKILTNLCDIDTTGSNPALKNGYKTETDKPEGEITHYLDDQVKNEGWVEHPLILQGNTQLLEQISIIQNGQGNDARELRVAAIVDGKKGYFSKNLKATFWKFIPSDCIDPDAKKVKNDSNLPKTVLTRVVGNFENAQSETYGDKSLKMRIKNFGDHLTWSDIEYTIGDKSYKLALNKRLGLMNFIFGKKEGYYTLVIPSIVSNDDELVKAFGGRKVIPVDVKQTKVNGKSLLQLKVKGKHPLLPTLVESVKSEIV